MNLRTEPMVVLSQREAGFEELQLGFAGFAARFWRGRGRGQRLFGGKVGTLSDLAVGLPPGPFADRVGVVILAGDRLLAVGVPPGPDPFLAAIDVQAIHLLLAIVVPVADFADRQVVAELALL